MRRFIVIALVLFTAGVALAQERRGLDQFTLYSSARASGTGQDGSWKNSAGVALDYAWSAHWTTKVSAEVQQHEAILTRFVPGEPVAPSTYFETFTTYPVDLQMTYRFARFERFTPFIGAGGRFIHTPLATPAPIVPAGELYAPVQASRPISRGSAELSAGALFAITPHFGITAEARRLLRNDGTPFDPLTKVSAGVAYRF